MKKIFTKKSLSIGILSLATLLGVAKQEKVVQIFRDGEVIQEYAVSDIDYIEVNDLIPAPKDVNATVSENQITIKWNEVEGATYNVYRSPDNVNFSLLASGLEETSYTDTKPLNGSNYYRVKALVGDVESGYTSSAAATLTSPEMPNGIYLGISAFNQTITDYPVLQLTGTSVAGFHDFVDELSTKNGTLLYYSVDQALNTLQTTELPADISTAAIVTFTDGLDQGSMMKDVPYDDDMDYLDALNHRIMNETVSGQPITAFSIGIQGSDVKDTEMFNNNLQKLASKAENATEVTSMSEVNAKFKEIAEKLSQSNYVQTINLKMPGLSNGTVVRFTFDNVNSADLSQLYIEGKFNLKERSLEDVQYVGLTSTAGTKIKGKVDDIFVTFTFEGVHTDNNVLIRSEFTDEWTYVTSNASWQINSEFDKTENSDIVTERSSAVVMLVLDCSSSLANDFVKAQNNANDFISTLYEAVKESEEPGKTDDTIYSTEPFDLSVAVWKDDTRFYLTPEQYNKANLNGSIVEGLVVMSKLCDFIISPELLAYGNSYTNESTMRNYYIDVLPSKDEASIISARYPDINSTLSKMGWESFRFDYSESGYWSTSYYYFYYLTDSSSYYINLKNYSGGNLASSWNSYFYLRGVVPLATDGPIKWPDDDVCFIAVQKDGKRLYISDADDDLSSYDEVEGVAVFFDGQKFIINLQDEQNNSLAFSMAQTLYGDMFPTYSQAKIISLKRSEINDLLVKAGGSGLSYGAYYFTNYSNSSGRYCLYLNSTKPGELYTISSSTQGYVRGVKAIEEE